jgi:hypothetical protein
MCCVSSPNTVHCYGKVKLSLHTPSVEVWLQSFLALALDGGKNMECRLRWLMTSCL